MRNLNIFRSIYAKFTVIFLGIWWLMNSLTFGLILNILAASRFSKIFEPDSVLFEEFHRVRQMTMLVFLAVALVGTVLILIVMRGVVRPIKRLSQASKEIARGNFDVELAPTSRDEVGRLTADFNSMARELRSIDLLRKDFVANISHEFKTPITSVKGYAKLMLDGELTREQTLEYAAIIARESERLSALSSNLLRLSELDSRSIGEQATAFSLDEQLRKTALLLEMQWKKKGIELDMDLEPVKITANEHLLQEVWLNLLHNAIKFSHPNGAVRVCLRAGEEGIRVDVQDSGIGIAGEDKARIFERFFKADRSRSQEGSGLGLVIAKKIVERMSGTVSFASELGKGTAFTVRLPRQ